MFLNSDLSKVSYEKWFLIFKLRPQNYCSQIFNNNRGEMFDRVLNRALNNFIRKGNEASFWKIDKI